MAFILLQLLVVGAIAAAADDVQNITWLLPPRDVVPCVVAEAGRVPRGPPPPLSAEPVEFWRGMPYKHKGEDDLNLKRLSLESGVEVSRKRNGTQGEYQCVLEHSAGLVLGYKVSWTFAYMDKQFSNPPESSVTSAGQPHVFSCGISSGPAAEVAWLRDDKPLPHYDRYVFLNSQLLITEVRKEDHGVYKCVATNSLLNKTRESNNTLLVVEDPYSRPPQLLEVHDELKISAPRFSRVQLLCPVTGWPRPQLTWELTSPGSRTAILEYTDQVLTLSRIEVDLEGVYKCYVDDHPHLNKVYNVTMTEPLKIILPPISKEVVRASTVRFNCTAIGRPKPEISWYKDGKPLVLGPRFNIRQSPYKGDYLELVIGAVTSADAGVYQCFARSGDSVASSWAALKVTGASAPAPTGFRCWPLNDQTVKLHWEPPPRDNVMAYTVISTLPDYFGQPHNNTEEIISVRDQPFVDFSFQVRAFFMNSMDTEMSDHVTCQAQGVPIRIIKQEDDFVVVSWEDFAEKHPTVVQWLLQYRHENSQETNVTLSAAVHNYSLPVSANEPLQVRVLGSKSDTWTPQNLTSVPWTPTNRPDEPATGDVTAIPGQIYVTQVFSRAFSIMWPCERCEGYTYLVCIRMLDGSKKCLDSYRNNATIDGLEPESEYEVEVYAKAPNGALGPASLPQFITTHNDGPQIFKDLTWRFINETTVRVSWNATPAKYSVSYSNQLDRPLEMWDFVDTFGNTALISGIDPTRNTYLMVTGYNPKVYSPIKTIPAQVSAVLNAQYSYTARGVRVQWAGAGARELRYSQNLTRDLQRWPAVRVAGNSLDLNDLDPALVTYVMVAFPGPNSRSQVLTIPPRPTNALYMGLGIACGLFVLGLLGVTLFCVWRKKKRAGSPLRARRRHASSNDDDEEEAAELKAMAGRMANGGGSKDAGEPLLNGHVHITENPQSKAPNGKMKKELLAFDLSRYEDPDNTLETVLEENTSASTTFNLLDSSRRPGESSHSFTKLPDDNMNSEITTEFALDNSKIQPTLQPNG